VATPEQFIRELEQIKKKDIPFMVERATLQLTLFIHDGVIKRMPYLTGQAIRNTKASAGRRDRSFDPVDPRAPLSRERAVNLARRTQDNVRRRIKPFGKTFVRLNASYSSFLEHGSSRQAPQGMVAVTLAEARERFKRFEQRLGFQATTRFREGRR